jgi:hypothetical protein
MMNVKSWAVASAVMAVLGACTTEATTDNPDGGSGTTSTTATGSTTSTTTGGAGGGPGDDGGTCSPSATATMCETCAFDQCKTETCDCKGQTDCNGLMDDYFKCISGLDGGDMATCAEAFAGSAGLGAAKAEALSTCMEMHCLDKCQGKRF